MKIMTILMAGLALSGCITMDNRVACTVAKDKAFFLSQYGAFSVGSQISDLDRQVICK